MQQKCMMCDVQSEYYMEGNTCDFCKDIEIVTPLEAKQKYKLPTKMLRKCTKFTVTKNGENIIYYYKDQIFFIIKNYKSLIESKKIMDKEIRDLLLYKKNIRDTLNILLTKYNEEYVAFYDNYIITKLSKIKNMNISEMKNAMTICSSIEKHINENKKNLDAFSENNKNNFDKYNKGEITLEQYINHIKKFKYNLTHEILGSIIKHN